VIETKPNGTIELRVHQQVSLLLNLQILNNKFQFNLKHQTLPFNRTKLHANLK
jgi:hypothetical protein